MIWLTWVKNHPSHPCPTNLFWVVTCHLVAFVYFGHLILLWLSRLSFSACCNEKDIHRDVIWYHSASSMHTIRGRTDIWGERLRSRGSGGFFLEGNTEWNIRRRGRDRVDMQQQTCVVSTFKFLIRISPRVRDLHWKMQLTEQPEQLHWKFRFVSDDGDDFILLKQRVDSLFNCSSDVSYYLS